MLEHFRATRPRSGVLALFYFLILAAASGCKPSQAAPNLPGGAEPLVVSHTVYTATVQHFDEHPPLVAGKPAKLAAHATDIRGDFKPVREGTLAVVALRDGKVVAESAPVKPSRPGIFGPVLTVPSAGPVELRIRLDAPGLQDDASLGEVPVFASEAEAATAAGKEEGADVKPIAFLKEQQWRIEFRNEPAAVRSLVERLRVPGRVVPRPSGRALVTAPASGRLQPPSKDGFPIFGGRVEAGRALGSIAPVLGGVEGTQIIAA